MKCNQFIKLKTVEKKSRSKKTPGKTIRIQVVDQRVHKDMWLRLSLEERIQYVECCGKISATVGIDRGYGCSCCSYPDFEVNYRCERCGQGHFQGLPLDSDGVSAMLTEHIASMKQPEGK